jgi:hypothetical protein
MLQAASSPAMTTAKAISGWIFNAFEHQFYHGTGSQSALVTAR